MSTQRTKSEVHPPGLPMGPDHPAAVRQIWPPPGLRFRSGSQGGGHSIQWAAVRNGVTPVWASETEPFPIRVTKHHFPDMLHVGDITRLDGDRCSAPVCRVGECARMPQQYVRRRPPGVSVAGLMRMAAAGEIPAVWSTPPGSPPEQVPAQEAPAVRRRCPPP